MLKAILKNFNRLRFRSSAEYWDKRYLSGGNSGPGSYGALAEFKARILNEEMRSRSIRSLIEWGPGDGNQLKLLKVDNYLGFDISKTAVERLSETFANDDSRHFKEVKHYSGETAHASASLDVIFHLVEDDVFDQYMRHLFGSAENTVFIYSSNYDDNDVGSPHVRHRQFTSWVEKKGLEWKLAKTIKNPFPYSLNDPDNTSFCDFFIYERRT